MTCPPHRWLIAPPSGTTSEGECRDCHEQKTFSNSYEGTLAPGVRANPKKLLTHRPAPASVFGIVHRERTN